MTLADRSALESRFAPAWVLRELFARQPQLAWMGLLLAVAMIPTGVLSLVDGRTLADVNVWIKPLKFMASLSLFALTMAWFVGYVELRQRLRWPVQTIAVVITAATTFEIVYITWQASNGAASHYNVGDSFHAAMYSLMGIGAVSLTASALALAVIIARRAKRTLAPAFKISLVLGLVLTFVLGTASGAFMSAQTGHFAAGAQIAPGLPTLGWSRIGGDWRVAHFFGIHAQQIVPMVGAIVGWLQLRRGVTVVVLFCLSYTVLAVTTFLQAVVNIPFIAT